MRSARGLTLVEFFVAITVFGILSAFAYRALTVVFESRGRIEQENRKWRGLELFFTRLEVDVTTAVPQPVRDADQVHPSAPARKAAGVGINGPTPMLTRTALTSEPRTLEARGLGYRLRGTTAELLTWGISDLGPRSELRIVAVLEGVKAMDVRYLDSRGQWHLAWPPTLAGAAPVVFPAAVEVWLELLSGERITRLLPTASTATPHSGDATSHRRGAKTTEVRP